MDIPDFLWKAVIGKALFSIRCLVVQVFDAPFNKAYFCKDPIASSIRCKCNSNRTRYDLRRLNQRK